MELQSFLLSNPQITLIYCILLSVMTDEHWIYGRKEHHMPPFLDVFATRNQPILNDRVRIVGASSVVDVLGEVVRQQHVVLQCRIDVFSYRVALKCSKV